MNDPTLLWEGRWLRVEQRAHWEYAVRTRDLDAVLVLAIDDAGDSPHVILVEQMRQPLQARCLELPAGMVGDECADEDPVVAAARELEEETGFRAAHWRALGRYASSPGLSSECFTLFEARGLTRAGAGGGIEGEDIVIHRVPMAETGTFVAGAIDRGVIIDAKVLLVLALAGGFVQF